MYTAAEDAQRGGQYLLVLDHMNNENHLARVSPPDDVTDLRQYLTHIDDCCSRTMCSLFSQTAPCDL